MCKVTLNWWFLAFFYTIYFVHLSYEITRFRLSPFMLASVSQAATTAVIKAMTFLLFPLILIDYIFPLTFITTRIKNYKFS